MRKCIACQEILPTEEYDKSKSKSSRGIRNTCKTCRLQWRIKNKDSMSAYNKTYWKTKSKELTEKRKEYARDYYSSNKTKVRQRNAQYKRGRPAKRRVWEARRRASKRNNGVYVVLDREVVALLSTPCFLCNSKENITIDHVIPICRGGTHSIGNLLSLCQSCNSKKGSKFLSEIRYS